MEEGRALCWLERVPGMGPARLKGLLENFGSALAAVEADDATWRSRCPEWSQSVPALLAKVRPEADEDWESLEKAGARVLVPTDDEFPLPLKSIPDPPLFLTLKGQLKPADAFSVALVGSRRSTPYGRQVAERLARELAEAGVTVVSGLARGIDTVAHTSALSAGGRTVGILGSGLGRFYPPENRGLGQQMAERGAVLSEFSWGTSPDRPHFPRRNRLIAGLALATVVVEADSTSGALITARLAAECGRDVCAVPGSLFSPLSRGPHRLLKDGARLVESAEDLLEDVFVFKDLLRQARPRSPKQVETATLTGVEAQLFSRIGAEPVAKESLTALSGLSPAQVSAALLTLEVKGWIKTLPGQQVIRSESVLSERF